MFWFTSYLYNCKCKKNAFFCLHFEKKATRIQNILIHSVWHFFYICDYKDRLISARKESLESRYLHSCTTLIPTNSVVLQMTFQGKPNGAYINITEYGKDKKQSNMKLNNQKIVSLALLLVLGSGQQ